MKRIIAVLALAVAPTMASADPVFGMFKTQPGDDGRFAHVEFYQCDANICGVIRKAFDASGSPRESDMIGKRIVWGMKARGDGDYAKGKIYAPDRDKTYNSKMKLSGDQLAVSGCVIGICRSQTWVRVK